MPKKTKSYRNYGVLRDHTFAIVLLTSKLPQRLVADMFGVDVKSIQRILVDYRRMNREDRNEIV